jgi:hypothetical protein
MILGRTDARALIRRYYPGMRIVIRADQPTVGVRPIVDPLDTLAWRALAKGADSAVRIGRVIEPGVDLRIDWDWEPPTERPSNGAFWRCDAIRPAQDLADSTGLPQTQFYHPDHGWTSRPAGSVLLRDPQTELYVTWLPERYFQ